MEGRSHIDNAGGDCRKLAIFASDGNEATGASLTITLDVSHVRLAAMRDRSEVTRSHEDCTMVSGFPRCKSRANWQEGARLS